MVEWRCCLLGVATVEVGGVPRDITGTNSIQHGSLK